MIIEGPFYKITPVNDSSPFFDLELLYDIGGKNPRKEFKIEGYGYTLETAIDRCCRYAVSKKYDKEEIITLKQYIDEYKKAFKEIKSELRLK